MFPRRLLHLTPERVSPKRTRIELFRPQKLDSLPVILSKAESVRLGA